MVPLFAKNLGLFLSSPPKGFSLKNDLISLPTIFFVFSSIYISEKKYSLSLLSIIFTFPFEKKKIFFH